MDDIVVIALFRHGLTEANKRKCYLGWTDSALCPESTWIEPLTAYDGYFSSDLERCLTTAKLLFPNGTPVQMREFREMNFGDWEGKTYEELKEKTLYQQWLSDPLRYSPPHGESFERFSERVDAGWTKLFNEVLSKNHQRCAVVTHGGVIRYLLTAYGPEMKDFWSWQVPHNICFEFTFTREAFRRGRRCTLLQEVPLTENGHG
ncbi:histidine phosphatase family protein [Neobacillus mesonae]|uniref:Histidine phosphatase family protein n=1 Tax=Neobacillus mesonae TaxID=1193713 RepID=A0A3Q9QRX4_9BACI|nr:histidine phosphatase family protein [Neobacillus mesonae]AZU61806.1 hypothetical protein CHR53_11235 [Neobacillus mesonae]